MGGRFRDALGSGIRFKCQDRQEIKDCRGLRGTVSGSGIHGALHRDR